VILCLSHGANQKESQAEAHGDCGSANLHIDISYGKFRERRGGAKPVIGAAGNVPFADLLLLEN
jgi:hypothetical protein